MSKSAYIFLAIMIGLLLFLSANTCANWYDVKCSVPDYLIEPIVNDSTERLA